MRGQKLPSKWFQSLELFIYIYIHIGKGFRSFHTGSIGSVGQRAAKLPALKVGGLKKKSADLATTAEACASVFGLGSPLPGVQSFSKFDEP